MEKLKKNWPMVLLLLTIAACMFMLNISTLISPDDYSYAYTIAGQDLKITSFSELLKSAKSIYMGWTRKSHTTFAGWYFYDDKFVATQDHQ